MIDPIPPDNAVPVPSGQMPDFNRVGSAMRIKPFDWTAD